MKQILGIVVIAAFIFTASCRKKEDPPVVVADPELVFNFRNIVGTAPLGLVKTNYTNANGDTFKVSEYLYYISNISVTTSEGEVFHEPESYHLINESKEASKTFTIKGLPPGKYVSMKFMIGVDSARNRIGAQTGALDPVHGMFWTWTTGYIMARMEGSSPQAGNAVNIISFHMGGFEGPYSVLKWVTLPFPAPAVVEKGKSPAVNVTSDVLEWFKTPNTIKFYDVWFAEGFDENTAKIADNYADMFKVERVDN